MSMEEIWKDIEGYEGIYQVSNLGRVRSIDRVCIMKNGLKRLQKGRIMAFFIGHDGYYIVKLCSKSSKVGYRVHRLVAMAFIANPNNYPYINHKDENKQNNSVDNLEWCTPKYNTNYGMTPQRISETHKKSVHYGWEVYKILSIIQGSPKADGNLCCKHSNVLSW